jgi:hypothetical protein
MPIHVEEMTTEVEAFEGELPLSATQLDKLVELVIQRLEEKEKEKEARQESTEIRSRSIAI